MDDATMERLAKAMLEQLLSGGDVIEIEEIHAHDGHGRRWRIRLVGPDAAG